MIGQYLNGYSIKIKQKNYKVNKNIYKKIKK
nr:MAG TPA: hypothetical protein [Caudoviricetes sp.]